MEGPFQNAESHGVLELFNTDDLATFCCTNTKLAFSTMNIFKYPIAPTSAIVIAKNSEANMLVHYAKLIPSHADMEISSHLLFSVL